MSIEGVMARITELQARIDALSPDPPAPALPPFQSAQASPAAGPAVRPFDVALAQATGQASVRPAPGKFAPDVEELIARYSAQNGLDPAVVHAVITAESDGDPKCVSSKGAMGLMQLMPEEVRGYGVSDPFNPEQNIAAGTRQLAEKLKVFGGDLSLALAAYNAGTGAVRKYGGIPPYRETQNYVKKIMGMLGR